MSSQGGSIRPLDADRFAHAVVLAASFTCELSQLAFRYEAALQGRCALRARWVALAALLSLYPAADVAGVSLPLGCGPTPLPVLARLRQAEWWDEGLVIRLVVELEDAGPEHPAVSFRDLRNTVAELLADEHQHLRERAAA